MLTLVCANNLSNLLELQTYIYIGLLYDSAMWFQRGIYSCTVNALIIIIIIIIMRVFI